VRRLERRRAGERAQELDALRRGEQLDAEDVAVLAIIGCRRRAANVAIETWSSWLALVGRLSTLAGWASDLFSLASDAAVTWAIMKPLLRPGSADEERRQARDAGVDEHRDAALGDRADLGDRDRHRVGGERDRLRVEVAARHDRAFLAVGADEDERVVGDRVRFAHEHERGMAQLVEAGADDLRLAAQAVRILDAVVALQVRAADLAAGEQRR
jgi:hypothetical protein